MNRIRILTAVLFLLMTSYSMAGVVIVDDETAAKKEQQDKQRNEKDDSSNRDDKTTQANQPKSGRDNRDQQRKNLNSNLLFGF